MSDSRTGTEPLVSVVIPAFKAEPFIEDAIGSIRAQSHRPIEVLVVEDCSPDDTAGVVERLASSWSDDRFRIRLLRQPHNQGGAAALARGFSEAEGEYLCWLSADDAYVGTAKLADQVAQLRDGRTALSYAQSFYTGPAPAIATQGDPVVAHWHHRLPWLDRLLLGMPASRLMALFFVVPINGSTVMIGRSAWERFGTFDEVLLNVDQDSDMWMRYSALGAKFALIEEPSGFYRIHPGQTSNRMEDCLLGAALTRIRMVMALEEAGLLGRYLRRALPIVVLGSRLTWTKRRPLAAKYLAEAGLRTSRNPLVRFTLKRMQRTLEQNALVDEELYAEAVERATATFSSAEFTRFRNTLGRRAAG